MSIQIGTTPLYQTRDTIIEVQSDRSNAMRLNSTSSNIYINMGEYRIGQTAGTPPYFVIEGDSEIVKFTDGGVTFLKPLTALQGIQFDNSLTVNSNVFGQSISTCNLTVLNSETGAPTIFLYNTGASYFTGSMGVGMSPNSNYDFSVGSNAYIGDSLYVNSNLFVDEIRQSPESVGKITFGSNVVSILAGEVQVTNLNILGASSYETIKVRGVTELDGFTFASNVVITNKDRTTVPFRIQQKRINNLYSDIVAGVPISVVSDFEGYNNVGILQLSPYGHVVLGGFMETTNDALITARVQSFRDQFFKGFMSFTNSNVNKDSLTVNKNTHLSIGNPASTAMFELRNNYQGNEQYYSPPTAMIQLQNTFSQNQIPILNYKLPDNSTRLQITSNASMVFHNTPLNIYKYDIETSNAVFMNAIETNSLRGFSSNSIDVNYTSFNRVNDIQAESATLSNVYIYTLTVDDIITDSLACFETLNDPEELRILSTKTLINSSNVVINRLGGFFSCNETSNLSGDTFRVYTSGTTTESINAIHAIGNNAEVTNRVTNTNTVNNTRANIDFMANQNLFKIGVNNKSTSPNTSATLYITPITPAAPNGGINDDTAAITINRDRSVRFGIANHIHPNGYLTIGQDAIQTDNRLYVKGNSLFLTTSSTPTLSIAADNPFVGINTNNPLTNLHVHNGNVLMTTSSTPSFSITAGNVGIGTSTGSYPFQVNLRSGFTHEVAFTSNVSIGGRLDTLGNVASTSDSKVKTELQVIEKALDKIEMLSGYIYRRLDTGERETGLLAQEVKEVLPEAVHQNENGMYSLAYGNLAGLFVEAIKELKHRLERLELKE